MTVNLKTIGAVIAVIILILVVMDYIRLRGLINISSSLVAKSKAYEQNPPEPKLKILFIGDSTGVGTGASVPEKSLAGRLGQLNPSAQVINDSINGNRSERLAKTTDKYVGQKFGLVVIHIGGNDIIRFKDLDQTTANIKSILDDLSPLSDQVAVFTTGNLGEAEFFPLISRPFYGRRAKYLRNQVLQLAKDYQNVTYVDLFNRPESLEDVDGYAADKLHLSDTGYELWHKALKDSLPKGGSTNL